MVELTTTTPERGGCTKMGHDNQPLTGSWTSCRCWGAPRCPSHQTAGRTQDGRERKAANGEDVSFSSLLPASPQPGRTAPSRRPQRRDRTLTSSWSHLE